MVGSGTLVDDFSEYSFNGRQNGKKLTNEQPTDNLNLTSFSLKSIPDTLYGCSCMFSESETKYNSGEYLYFNDLTSNCIISINNTVLFLKFIKEDIYENESYKVTIQNKKKLSSGGDGADYSADIVVLDKNSGIKTILKKVYGVIGC